MTIVATSVLKLWWSRRWRRR